jgi:hypothetical protein
VDPTVDPSYCGASGDCAGASAGISCATGQVCTGGVCAPLCLAGQGLCGGSDAGMTD